MGEFNANRTIVKVSQVSVRSTFFIFHFIFLYDVTVYDLFFCMMSRCIFYFSVSCYSVQECGTSTV